MKKKREVETLEFKPDLSENLGVQQFKFLCSIADGANQLGLDGKKIIGMLSQSNDSLSDRMTIKISWTPELGSDTEHMLAKVRSINKWEAWNDRFLKLIVGLHIFNLVIFCISHKPWHGAEVALVVGYFAVLLLYASATLSVKRSSKRESAYTKMIGDLLRFLRRSPNGA